MRLGILSLIICGGLLAIVGVIVISQGPSAPVVSFEVTLPPIPAEASSEQVHQMCGSSCHPYPPADSFPKFAWRKEVKQGYDFFRDSKLQMDYPSLESVVQYYEERAPEALPPIDSPINFGPAPGRFERHGFPLPDPRPQPGIPNVTPGP